MKIHSLTVKNFKIHRERRVEFDDRLTLLAGPNETGKSTLLEALEKAFFLRARGQTGEHRGIRSRLHTGHPEVEVEFSTGNRRFTLKKCFSGTNGTTLLQQHGGSTSSGDEADAKLAELLRVESTQKHGNQWSHLLIKQGASGENPTENAKAQSAQLLRRLQSREGASALLVSERDEKVASYFRNAVESQTTQAGKPKAGSELARASADAESAQRELLAAEKLQQNLQEAAEQHESATRTITEKTASLLGLKPELDRARKQLGEATKLEAELGGLRIKSQAATAEARRLAAAEKEMAAAAAEIAQAQQTLLPLEQNSNLSASALDAARRSVETREAKYNQASQAEAESRLAHSFAKAHLAVFQKSTEVATLGEACQAIREIRQKIADQQNLLERLPKIDAAALSKLEEAENKLTSARAALEATATKVIVESSKTPVTAGDATLSAGESKVLHETTELTIGATRLTIIPGGALGLDSAKAQFKDASDVFRQLLSTLGVESLAEARKIQGERSIASALLADLEKNLKSAKADKTEAALKAAEAELFRAKSELEAVAAKAPYLPSPVDGEDARRVFEDVESRWMLAQSAKTSADTARSQARAELAAAQSNLDECRNLAEGAKTTLLRAEAKLSAHRQQFGDDATLKASLASANAAATEAETDFNRAAAKFEEFQVDQLRRTVDRLEKSLDADREALNKATTDQAIASTKLGRDGSSDPVANLKRARILHETASKTLEGFQRKTAALQLLDRLFQEQRSQLAKECTLPFVEKITTYLRCIFGPRVSAEVVMEDGQFAGIRMARPEYGNVAFEFNELSGGSAEQVAAAARLAMAQILAEEHGGSLPVVFDDSFTNSDSARVAQIKDMLHLAADSGLQIVVFSCNPSDYSGSGAKETTLKRPRANTEIPVAQVDESINEPLHASDSPPVPVDHNLTEQFLSALSTAGGKSGNTSLQASLGWDSATYNAVKDSLVQTGRITKGLGRGGSVSLA
jgi:DNA repair exonuclease SbcCD ATPase subunit